MYCNAYCTELNVTYDRPQIHFSPWYAIAFERVHTREEAGRGRGIVTANINRRYAVSGAALIRRSRGPSLCTELCGIFAIFATPRLLCRCRFVVKWLPQLRAEKRKNRGKGDWLEGLSGNVCQFSNFRLVVRSCVRVHARLKYFLNKISIDRIEYSI